MFSEFKTFLLKANVLALALAFILGVALAAVVNSLVKDIILPPVGLLFGGVDFNNLFIDLSGKHPASLKAAQDAGLATINYGVFINTVIVFIIVAFVVFLIARSFIPKAAPTKMCQFCGEAVVLQGGQHDVAQGRVVFDDQHERPLPRRGCHLDQSPAVAGETPPAGSTRSSGRAARRSVVTSRSGPPWRGGRRP